MQVTQPEIAQPTKAMITKGQGRPTHLVSKNKKVRIWHQRFAHASNARIIRASRLVTGMGDFNIKYDPTKIYSDSKDSGSEHEDMDMTSSAPPTQSNSTEPDDKLTVNSSRLEEESDFDTLYFPCIASKQTRVVIRKKPMTMTEEKLDEVHVDLWGPHYPLSLSGKTYAAILLDEKTRKTWIVFLRSKDEFIDAFKVWLPKVENESKKSMKVLRADGGGEFISAKLKDICDRKGITIKYAAPYMHEENGLAKRGWRTVVTMKDSLLIDSNLPSEFWAEVMDIANYLRNRLPTKSQREELIPEEAWTGKKQDVSHVRLFGSVISILIPKEKRHKSDINKNWEGIFIGYSDTTKHVRVWASKTQQILLVSSSYVDESKQGAKLLVEHPLDITRLTSTKRKAPTGEPRPRGRPRKIAHIENTPVAPTEPNDVDVPVVGRESPSNDAKNEPVNADIKKTMSETEISSIVYKPLTYEQAVSDPIHGRRWKEAIEEEIQNLENHHTWEYDRLPADRKAVGSKWVFKVKYHPDGTMARYKARLVAQGFSQIHGVNFNKTFSPMVRRESLRIFLAISCLLRLFIEQVDIVGAYLKSLLGDNDLPIFMKLPPGMEAFRLVRADLVC